ncbi:hypothetical protein V6R21_16150 [Limibacter armeniacum]|uniref:hypothetical protein n=1 Tax=Limibacter armeniacum TaxID=466084 RepID=UPI002FE5C673
MQANKPNLMEDVLYFTFEFEGLEPKELFTLVVLGCLYVQFGRNVLKGSVAGINHMFKSIIQPRNYRDIINGK